MEKSLTEQRQTKNEPVNSRPLFEAFRYLQRGTRFRGGHPRLVPSGIAGHVFGDSGGQRSAGEIGALIHRLVLASNLTKREALVVSEFFGLWSYPADLASARGVAAFAGIGRTAAEEAIDSALSKIARNLEPSHLDNGEQLAMQTEADPFLALAESERFDGLGDADQLAVKRAAIQHAFDLTERAPNARNLQAAIRALAVRHHIHGFTTEIERHLVRQEHRNAANAACSIALHELLSEESLFAVENGNLETLLLSTRRLLVPGRHVDHPRYGLLSADDLDDDLLVIVFGKVFNRDDPDGLYADLSMEVLLSGQARRFLDQDTFETAVYALVRGLASQSDWRVIDLADWYAVNHPLSWNTVLFTGWAAHVASNQQYDHLAWRLTRTAERQIRLLPKSVYSKNKHALATYQLELIRSGCCLREGDRFLASNRPGEAHKQLVAGQGHLLRARTAWASATIKQSNGLEGLAMVIRRIELLVLEDLIGPSEEAGSTAPKERTTARRLLHQAQDLVDNATSHDQDVEQFQNRIDLLKGILLN